MFSINKVIQNFAALSTLVILCSLVRLFICYHEFNINIIPFIDVSDLIIYSIDLGFLMVSCGPLLFTLLLIEVNYKIAFIPIERDSKKTFSRLRDIIVLDCANVIPFGYLYLLPIKLTGFWTFITVYLIVISGINLILIVYLKPADYKNCEDKKIDLKTIVAISIFIISLVSCAIAGKWDAYKGRQMVSFCYNDETYISTDKFYMIGQTGKYVFMYDAKLKKTNVYPLDELKYFSINAK